MSKNNRILSSGYSFSVNVAGRNILKSPEFIRMTETDMLKMFFKNLGEIPESNGIKDVLLHSNINGNWTFTRFKKTKDSEYELEIKNPPCGKASFRFAVECRDGLYWEPEKYHELLIDPESINSIRLYTIIPNINGRIDSWKRMLPEIAEMGFNAVHILPVTAMGSSESPYSASELFSLDYVYGNNIHCFREFAEYAAELGIKICLDIVLNHISNENSICLEHAEWIIPDRTREDGMKRAGCYHHDKWISWEDLVLLNYDHPNPEIREELYSYMLKYVMFWIEAAGGRNVMMRLDNLHSSNREFIKWLLPEIRRKYPGLLILSEFFGAENHLDEAVVEYGLNLLTANSWEYPFAPILERYIAGIHSSAKLRYLVTPTSHDTEAAAKLFATAESSIPRYAVCALMGTGITGIVQGYEYGVPEKINFIGRKPGKVPVTEYDFKSFIKKVNSLLKNEPCLGKKGNAEFFDTGNDSLILCRRRDSNGQCLLIVVNLDIYNEHQTHYNIIGKAETIIAENAETEFNEIEDKILIKLGACGVCVIRTKR